ncbi:MAG: FHA domain-containing protein [Verrucomicrobiota bacterium]
MSPNAIHLRSYSPDLLVEFDLPPGSHARIGASPDTEITLPLAGISPHVCTLGRFQDGRLYLADNDGAISQRIDLPTTLSLPPYQFVVFNPAEKAEDLPSPESPPNRKIGLFSKLFHRP